MTRRRCKVKQQQLSTFPLKMSISGVICSSSTIPHPRVHLSASHGRFSPFPYHASPRSKTKLMVLFDRKPFKGTSPRHSVQHIVRASMDVSFGNSPDDSNRIFPGINIKDPYRRLGISKEAAEEEIQAARNFLIKKYAGHKPSIEAIESAHDKIIMQKFYERRSPKINVKKKIRDISQSRIIMAVSNRFQTPSRNHILKTTLAFIVLGVLTVLFPTEEGPTLQVLISFIAAIYFIHERLKSYLWSFLYGGGTFLFSWLLGTFLMVSVIPPLLRGPRSLEVTTALLSYVLLWVSSTYLKHA